MPRETQYLSRMITVTLLVGVTIPAGCGPVNGNGNQSPSASAGDNQTVGGGVAVTLDGSASTDPDGDDLTFTWIQTAGPSVALNGGDTDVVTFTAPESGVTLSFELTVTDGNGATDTDTVNIVVTDTTAARLFIANFGGDSVISYLNPASINGNIAPDTNLSGAQTQLDSPSDIIVSAEGVLIVSNFNGANLTSYSDAAGSNGNLEPDGNVQGTATQLADPTTLAVNEAEDLAFVADLVADDILVYASVSGTSFNGNLSPIRTLDSADLNNPFGINFGADDELYVANNGIPNIVVFSGASNLNGTVSATRIITSTAFDSLFDVFIDSTDTMFVVDSFDGEIYIFNDASSLNGEQTPDFTLEVLGSDMLTAVVVDSSDVGYIVDSAASAVYSYDQISALNGAFNPDRTIQGDQTQLSSPIRVFLTE